MLPYSTHSTTLTTTDWGFLLSLRKRAKKGKIMACIRLIYICRAASSISLRMRYIQTRNTRSNIPSAGVAIAHITEEANTKPTFGKDHFALKLGWMYLCSVCRLVVKTSHVPYTHSARTPTRLAPVTKRNLLLIVDVEIAGVLGRKVFRARNNVRGRMVRRFETMQYAACCFQCRTFVCPWLRRDGPRRKMVMIAGVFASHISLRSIVRGASKHSRWIFT